MFFRILKKDMLKRKAINLILFAFIVLATIFLASSVNNILVVANALDYYMDIANVPDVNIIVNTKQDKSETDEWLKKQKEDHKINDYAYNQMAGITNRLVEFKTGDHYEELETGGASIYLAKMDVLYNKVFDQEGNAIELNSKEMAISNSIAENNHLKIGDSIKLKIEEQEKEFKVSKIVKDAAFGNEIVGMLRLMINDVDYDEMEKSLSTIGLYYVQTNEVDSFIKELDKEEFPALVNTITRDTYKMAYSFDMIMSALLILIGICLIFIAMLVLRFTLIFTMEEQYQEIGILKAIGLRNYAIKKIYLVKYLAIVLAGSCLGLILSFPISNIMVEMVSKNMLMEDSNSNYSINIICALLIVFLVLLFCYLSTRKLNKISAITTIRGGETGERYESRRGISLIRCKHMPVSVYLGLNDILSHLKRFTVLLVTFAISFILITIPLNTVNTMRSDEMVRKFAIDPNGSVFVRNIEQEHEENYTSILDFEHGMDQLKYKMEKKGYQARLTGSTIYFFRYSEMRSDDSKMIMTIQLMGDNVHFLEYSQGKEPLLANEIAFSEPIMKENNWLIGDYVHTQINGVDTTFIITGTYSDYMQLGKSARLNPILRCDKETMAGYWSLTVDMDSSLTSKELASRLKAEFPMYEWLTAQELVDQNVGGIQDTLANLIFPMTIMLTLVIMLITLLMEKLLIAREKGELAMLKSMGFQYKHIRNFQITRMILISLCSTILAIPLSLLSNNFMLKPIFAIMGANVSIQVKPLEVYILYPAILLIGIIIAIVIATRDIKKIHIREMNTME